jgi:hypothetical protein
MASPHRATWIAAFLIAAVCLIPPPAWSAPPASANDTARFLAGMMPSAGSPLRAYTDDGFWKQHARAFDQSWETLEKRQLSEIRRFVAANLKNPQHVLFYIFSGPDFLYANTFFPSADTYIFAGLEPPGEAIDFRKFTPRQLAGALGELRSSLNSVLHYSFFRTKSMRIELNEGRMTGTLPILMVFLARSGKTIYDVSFFDLTSDGAIHSAEDNVANATAKGVKIVFSDNVGKKRTLYYFSTDVSDGGIKNSGFLRFCNGFGNGDSFVKSASYLMHSNNFASIRDFLLTHSMSLLQDDSGIPARFFAHGWRLQPFGRYAGPIALFAQYRQPSLYRLFSGKRSTAIDFGIGYRWRPNESNLLLAIRDPLATVPLLAQSATREAEAEHIRGSGDVRRDKKRRSRHRSNDRTVSYPGSRVFPYLPE